MTKNLKVQDIQPSNLAVIDVSPRNFKVQDLAPSNSNILTDFGSEQLFTVVLGAGQSMGLLLSLTYPVAGTVQSPITN